MKIFIGWDPKDELAFRACVSSLRKHSSIPLDIIPLRDHDLRRKGIYRREYVVAGGGQMVDVADGRPFSTQFSFTRFAIPLITGGDEWVIYCDADFLWRADIAEMLQYLDSKYQVMCVKHHHEPTDLIKMDGVSQSRYDRKNWSSLMALRPSAIPITDFQLNTKPGLWLHGMRWAHNIGELPPEWNWLHGASDSTLDPKAVHYTSGTPDMRGNELLHSEEWWRAVYDWKPEMNRFGI